eukprot:444680-Pyramimonas_sp.AAC.1
MSARVARRFAEMRHGGITFGRTLKVARLALGGTSRLATPTSRTPATPRRVPEVPCPSLDRMRDFACQVETGRARIVCGVAMSASR